MLILGRKAGEEIMIGEDIVITVFGLQGNQIRVGIEAPEHIPIHRKEVFLKIKNKQQEEQKTK